MAAHKEEEEFYVGVELDAASGQVRAHRNPNPNPKSPRGASATTAGPGRRKKKKPIPPQPSSPVVSGKRKKKPRIDPEEFLAHSYKRAPPIWSPEDELRIAEALLSATNQGQINMSLYYEHAREFLPPRSNNTQLYEKMRRMRSRYRSIQNRVANADEELGFQFKSEHEARLYQIWKRIWSPSSADADNAASQRRESSPFSNESEQNDNNGNNNNDNDNDNDNEDDEENSGSENKNRNLSDIGDQNGVHPRTDATETAFLEKVFGKFQSAVENMEASFAKAVESLADRGCKRVSDVVDEAEKGRLMSVCGCSKVFAKFNELRSEAMSSREIPPGVSSSDAQALQEKWRSLWLDELKVFSQRLELMQEECKLCIRGIESSNGAVSSNPS